MGGKGVNQSDDDAEVGAELVMPFVNVTSRGGVFDDGAYTAGYEAGLLDAELRDSLEPVQVRTLRADNREQADLIAMRHGWACVVEPWDDNLPTHAVEGWLSIRFERLETASR